MKRIFHILLLCLCPAMVSAQTIAGSGRLDIIHLAVINADGDSEKMSLCLDNSKTDGVDVGQDAILEQSDNTNPNTKLSALIYESDKPGVVDTLRSFIDFRPYAGRYAVDFPLYLKFAKAGTYTLAATFPFDIYHKAAVIVRLIDTEHPDADVVDLAADGASHPITVDVNKEYFGRWVVRVYAACLLKKKASAADWTKADNWVSGHIPGQGVSTLLDNAAYIPEESEVVIPAGTTLTVGALFDGGLVTIKPEATLTVSNGAHLSNFSDIW